MKKNESSDVICPFCDEGTLEEKKCDACKKTFLMCDECDSVYRDEDSLDKEFSACECPYCGAPID
jgi:hypothetical protein